MKLAMMGGNGAVRFIHGTCEIWTGPKTPGEFGVSILTPQGMAGFIFDEQELGKFVLVALRHIAEQKGTRE